MKRKESGLELKFETAANYEHHVCESYRDADWIIHRCPQCDYEMRDNWRTGELIVKNSKVRINHSGSYFPEEYIDSFENQN